MVPGGHFQVFVLQISHIVGYFEVKRWCEIPGIFTREGSLYSINMGAEAGGIVLKFVTLFSHQTSRKNNA
jgi:hypothetical protein